MKLLVTGGAGFIGSNFIHYWLAEHAGDRIVNVDSLTYAGNPKNLEALPEGHEMVCRDICDPGIEDLMDGVDAVVHFAAESHVDRSILASDVFVKTNVLGTQRLLEAAKAKKVQQFVHVSTDEVYGALGPTGEFTEDLPMRPNSPYAASKAGADLLARAYFKTYGTPVVITRSCNNYGPYQYPEKLIPLMVTNAFADLPLPVYGQGAQVREWIHATDHCRALEAELRRGKPGEVYNVGSGYRRSNLEVVQEILRQTGKPQRLIQYVADRLGHDFRYALDCSKILNELQWEAQITFEEGLAETIRWYKEKSAWVEAARGPAYHKYYAEMYENRDKSLPKK